MIKNLLDLKYKIKNPIIYLQYEWGDQKLSIKISDQKRRNAYLLCQHLF